MIKTSTSGRRPPTISVVLPVYNAGVFLREAVDSIRRQTFEDFEVIAIDDASTDSSLEQLESVADPRFRIVRNPVNLGIATTLNKGMSMCDGEFVARMDADDVCLPQRFERQVDVLRSNPRCVMTCTGRVAIDESGETIDSYYDPPAGSGMSRWKILTGNYITHPSVMMRRSLLPNPLYESRYDSAEDYAAWLRLSMLGDIHVLPEKLVKYRFHGKSVSQSRRNLQVERACAALASHLDEHFGVRFSDSSLRIWSCPEDSADQGATEDLTALLGWMNPLRGHFRRHMDSGFRRKAYVHYARRLLLIASAHRRRTAVLGAVLRTLALSAFAR